MTLLAELSQTLPVRYYLGLDVGYREHVAVAISLQTFVRGDDRWQRARCLHFASTRAGLRQLQQYLDRFSLDPTAFLGLCEPTGGYYGATVGQYLLDAGYRLLLVDNGTTRHMREKIFGALPKTDDVDARVMARMGYLHEVVGEEYSLRPLCLPAAEDAELLALCRTSWKLNVMVCRLRNQFGQLAAVIFPELKEFFTSSITTVVPVRLLAAYPCPAELAAAPAADVAAVLRRAGGYRHAGRVDELQALAADSSGLLPDPGRAWRLEWLTGMLGHCFAAQASLDTRLQDLVSRRDDYRLLAPIPYAGVATLGVIIAVTRDVDRFPNYRQYVAYTGYFAGLEKSQTIDRTRMSKRGNRDLKRALFQIVAPLVWFDQGNNPYKALYERKKAEGRPWYEAMPFACAALARHIYHCLKFKEPYDVSKAFQGSAPRAASDEVLKDLQADLAARFEVMAAHLSSD
jgi:Transposase/Transposase IS116/IS110/IS902 family